MLTGENRNTRRKTCPSASLSTIKSTQTHILCCSVNSLCGPCALSKNLFIGVNNISVHSAVFISANERIQIPFSRYYL